MGQEKHFASGKEHKIYMDPHNANMVIKRPRAYHMWGLNTFFKGPQTVVDNLIDTQRMVRGTEGRVRLPLTMVLYTNKGYEIHQEFLEDDPSVKDVRQRLQREGLDYLAGRARTSRDNFAVVDDIVYVQDPTLFLVSQMFKEHPKAEKVWRTFLRRKNQLKEKSKKLYHLVVK